MSDIKNPFSFGTGDIDKDLWLRDIDNEQEDFITRYGSATNKHRTALLRQAFQDLRTRIANGDMLNRTADGLYQFGSALIRDDKHMQEAYQRALGFMGDLARRQLSTPAPEPEKKKFTGSTLEDEFKKSLGPDGRFNEKAYWARTPEARGQGLLQFLTGFKNRLNDYQDFSSFTDRAGLESRLDAAIKALNDKKYDDWSLSLLGFTSDWINKPVEETTEQPKSDYEQALERYNAALLEQQTALLNQQILAMTAPDPVRSQLFLFTPSNYWTYDSYARNLDAAVEALKETDTNGNTFLKAQSPLRRTPNGDGRTFTLERTKVPTAWNGEAAEQARTYAQLLYNVKYHDELNNFFKGLGVNYLSYLNNSDKLKALQTNLAKLFTVNPKGNSFISPGAISKYFVQNQDGTYGLKGSNLSYDPSQGILYQTQNIGNYKEGGVIKGEDGLIFNSSRYITTPKLEVTDTPKDKKSKEEMTTGDWVNILGPVTLDIGSMLAANVPGYGTLASGITGLGSTIWSGINDASKGQFSAAGTLASLGADAFGLVPGWGMSAKVGKIAKNVLRYSKPIMYAFTARGLTDAGNVLAKGIDKGFDSLDKNDWEQLAAGFTSLMGGAAKGTAAIKRSNLQEMRRASASKKTFNYIDNNGDIKSKTVGINDDISGELRVSRPKISADKEGVIKGRTQALDGFNAGYGIASNKRFGMLYEQARQGDVPLHSWETWEWKVPRLINTDKAKQQLMKLRGSQKPKTETPKAETPKAETPKTEPKPKKKATPKKKKVEAEKKQLGGILKALRNGGIIKAQWGDNSTDWNWTKLNLEKLPTYVDNPYFPEITYNTVLPWYKERWNNTSLNSLVDSKKYTNPNLLGRYTGTNLDFAYNKNMAYVRSGLENKQADIQNYFDNSPLMYDGDLKTLTDIYNSDIDKLYNTFNKDLASPDYLKTDASPHNNLFKRVYASRATGKGDINSPDIGWDQNLIGIFGSNSFARRPVNYETKFEDDLKTNLDLARDRVSKIKYNGIEGYVYTDENGRIHPVSPELLKTLGINNKIPGTKEDSNKALKSVNDNEVEIKTPIELKLKNPWDPTLATIAGKTLLGLRGNRDIYGNLLKEMPQAPLRDPIDRKLAIVGWQELIKQGLNQLADLRNIYGKLVGSDALVNLAGALEVEGKGRDIMNDKFMKDSERQFATAQRSWDLDNDDYLKNNEIYYLNDKARKDRTRMMAQIRAAWRSGDNNILMGGFADASNWLLKRYQREQDVVDRARGIELGTPESRMQERLVTELGDLANKKPSEMTAAEIAKVEATKAKILRQSNKTYASDYYNMFHVPGFGGGYYTTIAKDGTKLEVEKLKARGKDNDRYVSMIKDLRQSSRRRRRR